MSDRKKDESLVREHLRKTRKPNNHDYYNDLDDYDDRNLYE